MIGIRVAKRCVGAASSRVTIRWDGLICLVYHCVGLVGSMELLV